MPLEGLLVVDKPSGPTSHDVVTWARRTLHQRQIGHTGTLDPMATGLLALVAGRATRLARFYSGHDKAYVATLMLGIATDTWDRTGRVLSGPVATTALPDTATVRTCLDGLVGVHEQSPPPYSAKMVDGVRAYELARRGLAVPMRAARVTLHRLEIVAMRVPLVDIEVTCSAGFYVRALADEVGRRLGCGARLEALRRTAIGALTLDGAVTIEDADRNPGLIAERLIPLPLLLPDLPAVVLTAEGARRAGHGNEIDARWLATGAVDVTAEAYRLFGPDGSLIGVAHPGPVPGVLHPTIVLK